MIYVDHAASTPADPRVVEAMLPWFTEQHANASSPHRRGTRGARAVDVARAQVADLIACEPSRVIFTSGATEALNAAASMASHLALAERRDIAVGATEHKATLAAADAHSQGRRVLKLPPSDAGRIPSSAISERASELAWAAVMAVNNETGVANPYKEIASALDDASAISVCDLTQAVGKTNVELGDTDIDIAALSGHKMGGPQGVGALIAPRRRPDDWKPHLVGGRQERGLRAGTLNLPAIVGFGEACQLAMKELDDRLDRVTRVREAFLRTLHEACSPSPVLNAQADVPHILNLWIPGIDNSILLAHCPDIAFATGSACNSDLPEPSHVLMEMGLGASRARESIRVSFSHSTTIDEAAKTAGFLGAALARIAELESQ